MLKDQNIVVFSDDWGRLPSSCQHLVRQLLPQNRVLWVNTIGMRSPRLTRYDLARSFQILSGWLSRKRPGPAQPLPEHLSVVSPVIVPYNGVPFVRTLNRLLVRRRLHAELKRLGMTNPVVVTTFPCTCDYVGELGERLHVYYCVDDFVNWPDVDLKLISQMEETLLGRCDLALASSGELCRAKALPGRVPELLAHGVEVERFACRPEAPPPAEISSLKGPVIGFFGVLSAWLDFGLIAYLARSRPQWDFAFIGPVDTDISAIEGIPNVHLLGKVPYQDLPRWAARFDVGIIPFQVNELTRSVNPLKLLEYLSLGLPVVSSYMPEVERFSDLVAIPRSREEFLAALDRALIEDSPEARSLRVETARRHSWQAVAERFSSLVGQALAARGARVQAVAPGSLQRTAGGAAAGEGRP